MTKDQFKTRWERDDGGGITFDDTADCAIEWGAFPLVPGFEKCWVADAENYKPEE